MENINPRPWKYITYANAKIETNSGIEELTEEDAEYMLKCVNEYDSLVAEIERLKCALELTTNLKQQAEIEVDRLEKELTLYKEKDIPKSPIMKKWNPSLCPNCKTELSESVGDGYYKDYENLKICECGQKLNWDYKYCDEDEKEKHSQQ